MNVQSFLDICRVPPVASDEWGANRQAVHNTIDYIRSRCADDEVPPSLTTDTPAGEVVEVLVELATKSRRRLRFPSDSRQASVLASNEGIALETQFQPGIKLLQQPPYRHMPFSQVFA